MSEAVKVDVVTALGAVGLIFVSPPVHPDDDDA